VRVERPLAPEEAALWARVIATVRPLARPLVAVAAPEASAPPKPDLDELSSKRVKGRVPPARVADPAPPPASAPHATRTLDGGWDRRLARGLVGPDSRIDLHGHTLDRAYARIDFGLEEAIRRGDRVVLLVTGKPRPDARPGPGRGAIRAVVEDWLAASRHARAIAAVRAAHPRHGGAGALYLILRRA
jgi:DNA-nicking Smr family endonuclease